MVDKTQTNIFYTIPYHYFTGNGQKPRKMRKMELFWIFVFSEKIIIFEIPSSVIDHTHTSEGVHAKKVQYQKCQD